MHLYYFRDNYITGNLTCISYINIKLKYKKEKKGDDFITHLSAFLSSLILIFLAEMGDKTQLLICSLASKYSPLKILIGVAIGTLFSHASAILVGTLLSNFKSISFFLQLIAYISFILFGIISLKHKNKENATEKINTNLNGIILSVAIRNIYRRTWR